ncbi:MAG: GspE/PulE family protein [Candidatus Neomarinimicrobiota bacterium]|tara:strand:+ start:2971 stop:4635 length:1665 start_codon:yes stop_codon:yes gene_type:complete
MATLTKTSLGQILTTSGKLDPLQLRDALEFQIENGGYLGKAITELQFLTNEELIPYLSRQLKVPFLKLGYFTIDEDLIELVSEKLVRSNKIFPLFKAQNTINLAVVDPLDPEPINLIREETGLNVEPILCLEEDIINAIDLYYGISSFLDSDVKDDDAMDISDLYDESQVVELVNGIITQSQRYRCSDIHIEPRETDIRVRFRIDGKLQDFQVFPKSIQDALTSRMKIMANMDIAESRRPQDGRILFKSKMGRIDLRISTYPTLFGEKTVLRLLNLKEALFPLSSLGFRKDTETNFSNMLYGGEGIILVSGPTGSGKTTTLYSTLNKMEKPDINIVTIEDPIEFDLENINQAQVNTKSGVTFASALRSILRQDPDIIMVGEIRDDETVELAIRAALTGHLVFSTIHTNDAASGFARLLNWEIEPFLIASTVKGILAQRLVRRICDNCRVEHEITDRESTLLKIDKKKYAKTFMGKGCLSCRNSGYRGRVGLYELLKVDEKVSELVLNQEPSFKIKEMARKNGMMTMLEDGLQKALDGKTSLHELIEVLGSTRDV